MRRFVAVLAILPFLALAGVTAASGASHSTYPLGKATKCRAGFVKKTERHTVTVKVHGKNDKMSRRYVACVWQPVIVPTTTLPSPATTPTATPTPSGTPETTAVTSITQPPVVVATTTATTTLPLAPALVVSEGVVTDSRQIDNWAYSVVTVPVALTNAPTLTIGTVTLTNPEASNVQCQSLVYSVALKEATTTCTFFIENDPAIAINVSPSISFTGDANFAPMSETGPAVSIPAAPAPFVNNIQTELQCAESGGFCSEYNSAPETTSGDANVYAGPENWDLSPQIGTVTFTSADHLLVCAASVYSAADLPSNNARCTGDGGPFEGPLTVTYSGGSVEIGDTEIDVYSPASTVGGSN